MSEINAPDYMVRILDDLVNKHHFEPTTEAYTGRETIVRWTGNQMVFNEPTDVEVDQYDDQDKAGRAWRLYDYGYEGIWVVFIEVGIDPNNIDEGVTIDFEVNVDAPSEMEFRGMWTIHNVEEWDSFVAQVLPPMLVCCRFIEGKVLALRAMQ